MNRYILIRRLRGPAILLLIGLIALLHTTGVLHSFWRWFWPFLFILLGLMLLAERAALATEEGFGMWSNGGGPNGQTMAGVPPYPNQQAGQQTGQSTSIVPAASHDFGKDPDGGQS